MEILPFTGATSGTTRTDSASSGNDIGQDAFLQLLITQMRYQDPLSPMENEEFIAQLAQFSSLEQMQQLNSNFESMLAYNQSEANSAATSLIGREVRAAGNEIQLGENGTESLGYFLSAPASAVEIQVKDGSGQTVRTLVANDLAAGSHHIEWDGRDAAGSRMPAGTYTFATEARTQSGDPVPVTNTVVGMVDGVTFQSGQALLLVEGREVPLSSILEVFAASSEDGDEG